MPLITTSVPNLVQGVSQQPDNLRYPGQAELQVNAYSSVVEGLVKRPNSRHVGDLFSSPVPTDSLVHFVERDASNKHVMVFANNSGTAAVNVFNAETGAAVATTISADAQTYLNSASDPLKNLRALTVADYTFVANKLEATAMTSSVSDELHEHGSDPDSYDAIVFVKQGDYEKAYKVTIDDTDYSITSGASSGGGDEADTTHIATELATALGTSGTTGSLSGFTGLSGGSGYTTPPAVTFTGGGGDGAAAVSQINSSGVVVAIVLTDAGSGYTSPPTVAIVGSATATAVLVSGSTFSGTVTQEGGILKISKSSSFVITVSDGLSDTGLGLVYKEVSALTDLPAKCFDGHRVKVKGDLELVQDDYYVKFETKDDEAFGEGSWVEDVGYGVETTVADTSMPVQIVPAFTDVVSHGGSIYKSLQPHTSAGGTEPGTGGGAAHWVADVTIKAAAAWSSASVSYAGPQDAILKFFIQTSTWTNRLCGDGDTNPDPSFIGNKINDVFFFKNRLGLLTDGAVIFSEADQYFNFFRTTTLSLLDSAPIDVGVSHTKVSMLKHAVPFQEKLVIFSPQSQFVLRGTDLLTPKTVNISPITEYDVNEDVKPLALTNYVYFPFARGGYEGVYEFYVDKDSDVFDASEITAQVPKYIPSANPLGLRQLAGTPAEDVIVATTNDNLKQVYVYRYFWQDKEKIQSAWMRFDFADDVIGVGFIDSYLYAVVSDAAKTHLVRIPMESGVVDTGKTFSILLDKRLDGASLTDSYATGKTTITGLPYDPNGAVVYTKAGARHLTTRVSATSCTVPVDVSAGSYWLGFEYDMTYEFTTQTLKQPTERGGRSTSNFTNQILRNGAVEYSDTGHFTIEVTPLYRDTYSYAFNPSVLGADSVIGSLVLDAGSFRFPIHAQHDEVSIKITSSSALPAKLLAAEFESFVTPRSRRYGS